MSGVSTGSPTAGRGRHVIRGVISFAAVPVFFGSIYFAARSGIDVADRQVPPGSVAAVGQEQIGGRWRSLGDGGKVVVADAVQALREYAFQQSIAEPELVRGVREIELAAEGWEIEVLPGGDRRFLRVELRADGSGGEVFWLRAEDLRQVAKPVDG